MCVNFLNGRFLRNISWQFYFTLRVFTRSRWHLNYDLASNKITHYLLEYGNFNPFHYTYSGPNRLLEPPFILSWLKRQNLFTKCLKLFVELKVLFLYSKVTKLSTLTQIVYKNILFDHIWMYIECFFFALFSCWVFFICYLLWTNHGGNYYC